MPETACIDEALQEVFAETDLLAFQSRLVFDKQLTRLEHFYHVTDKELKSYGLSEPAIRRLRAAIERKRRKRAKLFGKSEIRLTKVTRAPEPKEQPGFEFYSTQPFLIPKAEIQLREALGEGNFSVVRRALWTRPDGSRTDCAVKILHEMSEAIRQDLAVEISNMQKLRHQNLVQLFGVVFAESTLMVLEFCAGGSLLNRLREQQKPRPLVSTLLNYAQQIANGMGYLESRRCVHRDLAARNVLLTHEDQIIKICDFGLARALSENQRLYVMNEPKKVPFSWCPPESLRYRQFSHKSDVWAFGVTMWELYTYGEEPWIGCRAAEVLQLIESGQRLRKPGFCPPELYELMGMCWQADADQRPKFSHLRQLLMEVKLMRVVCRLQHPPPPTTTTVANHRNDGAIGFDDAPAAADDSSLELKPGDEVILVAGDRGSDTWYGQSVVSRRFGHFPHSCVSVREENHRGGGNKSGTITADEGGTQMSNGGGSGSSINGPADAFGEGSSIYGHPRQQMISFPVAGSFIHTGHGDINESRCWGHVDHIEGVYLRNPIIGPSSTLEEQQKVVFIIPSLLDAQKPAVMANGIGSGGSSEFNGRAPATAVVPLSMPISYQGTNAAQQQQQQQQRPQSGSSCYSQTAVQVGHRQSSLDAWEEQQQFAIANVGTANANVNQLLSSDASFFDELLVAELASGQRQQQRKNSAATTPPPLNLPPPQHTKTGSAGSSSGGGSSNVSTTASKYDSSFSIPRPNRNSPVNNGRRTTPPPLHVSTLQSFGPAKSASTSSTTAAAAAAAANSNGGGSDGGGQLMKGSSLPSSSSTLHSMAAAQWEKLEAEDGRDKTVVVVREEKAQQQQQKRRPTSTHSMFDTAAAEAALIDMQMQQQVAQGGNNGNSRGGTGEDPFLVKEDVRTLLTTKLPYKDVHKTADFLLALDSGARPRHPHQQSLIGSAARSSVPIFDAFHSAPTTARTPMAQQQQQLQAVQQQQFQAAHQQQLQAAQQQQLQAAQQQQLQAAQQQQLQAAQQQQLQAAQQQQLQAAQQQQLQATQQQQLQAVQQQQFQAVQPTSHQDSRWPANVAVVHPIMVQQQQQQNAPATLLQNSSKLLLVNSSNSSAASSSATTPNGCSLLPPPSELLLSGLTGQKGFGVDAAHDDGFPTGQKKNGILHHQYQPIFDISGQFTANHLKLAKPTGPGPDQPRIRYGSNGIPILEPMPVQRQLMTVKEMTSQKPQEANKCQQQQQIVTLGELDTDALLRRVKAGVDFASPEQCRHFLLRAGFDVDKAVQELKVEKLLEMGLATDRAAATSVLDCEQWDVNAAANRLCCS